MYFRNKENDINDDKLLKLIEIDKERLYRIAYVYVKNEDDAREIVQIAVYKAFLNIKKLKDINAFSAWITRILVNSAMDYLKNKNRFSYGSEEELNNLSHSDSDYIYLYEAIDKLRGLEKTIIILKYLEDYKIVEIAKILEIPESKVKNYLHKGLKLLRIELIDDENGILKYVEGGK